MPPSTPPHSIAIIGAGIAGLSAGVYAQLNGYQTRIFELHTQPGGLCTAWKRKGYTIDGCLHWLVGSRPGSGFNHAWQELGALAGRQIVNHEEFVRVISPDGKAFICYTDVDRLERHLKELAPIDAPVIGEMTADIRRLAKYDPPLGKPRQVATFIENMKQLAGVLPVLGILNKYRNLTISQYLERFKDPFLRQALGTMWDLPEMSALALLFTLAYMHRQDAGYPIGGSLAFSQAIAQRYCDLGGEIHYHARVVEILVVKQPGEQNARAVGVRLEDGQEYRAERVVSAADGYSTIFQLLDGRFVDAEIQGYYQKLPIFQPLVLVALGVDQDLSDLPHMATHILDEPVTIAGQLRTSLGVKHYCYDPTLAPPGKSVVQVMLGSQYQYWKDLSTDPERYEAEKQQAAITVIEQLDKLHPGLAARVEMVDVATPLTFERYTGNWQGSFEGWLMTPQTIKMSMNGVGMRKTLPGLANFYMIGQWVEPGGGVPTGALTARNLVQILCHQDGRAFKTS